MALTPILPVFDGESLTSYLARSAAFHARLSLNDFLSLIEVPRSAVISPRQEDLLVIENAVGLSMDTLLQMTFLSHGGRLRSIRGHQVNAEFTHYDQVTFCPKCLLEDGRPESPSRGHRIGRLNWRINHVRACTKHGIALYRQKVQVFSEKMQDMNVIAPGDTELKSMAELATPLGRSGLQEYLEARITGQVGPEWLDSQALDEAARACEMLGIILTKGTHCNLDRVSQAEWHQAGHTGFGFAAGGEQGIRDGLSSMLYRFHEAGLSGGAQMAFGRLYQWLQFHRNRRTRGPIRDVAREFLLDNFPFEPGVDLFGEPVVARRVHTIGSLSVKSGMHIKTLNRAIVFSGLATGCPDVSLGSKAFDATAAEDLVRRIENSISVVQLPAVLNCNRTQAQQLVRTGLIKRITDSDEATGVLTNVPIEEATSFLASLLAQAKAVAVPSEGMMDIVTAATVSRWPFMDIIAAVLSGKLTKVEVVDPELKFKGVLVHPDEIVDVMRRASGEGLLELKEATRLLDWPHSFAATVINMKTPDGVDYIPKHGVTNAKGRMKFYVRIDDLQKFRLTHVSLAEHAASLSIAPRSLLAVLKAKGIAPLPTDKEKPLLIYRLADMPG